jgi:hypothetical protein
VFPVTRWCLGHKRLVVLAWLVLTLAGALAAGQATGRLTHSFATPGTAGYDANLHMSPHGPSPPPTARGTWPSRTTRTSITPS